MTTATPNSLGRAHALKRHVSYPPGLCAAVVKGIQVIKRGLEEVRGGVATVTGAHPTYDRLDMCPEDVLYEMELEDMCEQGPST